VSYCGQCGERVADGDSFCGSCGAPVSTVEVSPTLPTLSPIMPSNSSLTLLQPGESPFDPAPAPTTVTPATSATPVTRAESVTPAEPVAERTVKADEEWLKPARRSLSPAMIVGFLAIMALAAGLTIIVLGGGDDESSSPSATNATVTTVAATEPSTSVAATTSTTSSTTTTTTPPTPEQQLAATRDTDHAAVEAMVGRWAPQLSGKKVGTVDNGITYDLSTLLTFHEGLASQYGALLLYSGDYNYQTTDLWVSIAPESFATSQGAIDWCVAHSIGRDDCFAKLITHDMSLTNTVKMQP